MIPNMVEESPTILDLYRSLILNTIVVLLIFFGIFQQYSIPGIPN